MKPAQQDLIAIDRPTLQEIAARLASETLANGLQAQYRIGEASERYKLTYNETCSLMSLYLVEIERQRGKTRFNLKKKGNDDAPF